MLHLALQHVQHLLTIRMTVGRVHASGFHPGYAHSELRGAYLRQAAR